MIFHVLSAATYSDTDSTLDYLIKVPQASAYLPHSTSQMAD